MQTTHFVIIHRPVRHSASKAYEELLVKLLKPDKKVLALKTSLRLTKQPLLADQRYSVLSVA